MDKWSRDRGVGANYSQQAVDPLAMAAGLSSRPG